MTCAIAAVGSPLAAGSAVAATAPADASPADGSLTLERAGSAAGGRIAPQFVGFSVEWSLIERYMNPAARPAFANLLGNLGSGVLRIGGSSQDLMQYDPAAPNTLRVITPEDLDSIRATLAAVDARGRRPPGVAPGWGTILGTALAPVEPERPWVGPEHARRFADGVQQVFAGPARRAVVSIGLGNEPDISYDYDLARYLADLAAYTSAGVTRPFAVDLPSTSEPIAPWQSIAARTVPTRFFWDWPAILDAVAPATKAVRASAGLATTDHFYPAARGCATDEYRCATIERLLSDERMANFAFQVHTHAGEAKRRGLDYRLGELNTAAGRGVDGVSNVAASAIWALDTMFSAACPQPPDAPGANSDCRTGAIGVNFHNSEVNAFFAPEEGNAFYNAIAYDPSPAAGAPSAMPEYYALLLFSRFAQDTRGLRPVPVAAADAAQPAAAAAVKAWRVGTDVRAQHPGRLFLINKGAAPATIEVATPGTSSVALNRMTPHDPTGGDRTLDAPQVRIDGRSVAADGSWPGFAATAAKPQRGRLQVRLGGGETVVVTPR
ncbi:MAG: hypothetical protein Q8O56_04755 [Solirubrobacteraceae bacterium]|nr:hypothetical protein [Solirubrobacteraceae bacterium]